MSEVIARLESALADRYTIRHELGRGGMAVVYLAYDLRHERRVAIKVLRPELTSQVGSERFLREIKLTAALTHPHILPVLDSGQADGLLYYAMPYVEGESLRDRLEREGRLEVDEAVRIAREVADALSYAHAQDLLHRDIKPENILLEAGHAVVADFGIARALSEAGGPRLTSTGVSIGTPAYMSPEQAAGEQALTKASDLYSLGCVLYEMLAGASPFAGSAHRILSRKVLGEVRPLGDVRPEVPAAVEAAVITVLAAEPEERFGSAGAFMDALGGDGGAAGSRRWKRRWLPWAAAAALVMAAAAAGLWPGLVPPASDGSEPGEDSAIAVLPFENISPDSEAVEWFVYGVREEISDRLRQLGALTVRPPETAALVYGDGARGLAEMAAELRVGTLVTASARVVGDRFRLIVRLVDVEADTALWQETYDGEYTTGSAIFDTQSDVAERVASALGAAPTVTQRAQIERRPTENVQAWNLYRQGRFHESRPTPESLHRAIDLYDRAIDEDPDFGQAYAGKASAYQLLAQVERWSPDEQIARVSAAAEQALQIDSTLADPYPILGEIKFLTWDFSGAERDFETAVRLDPNEPRVHLYYSQFLNFVGRHEEAIAQILWAREIDPIDPFIAANVGAPYYIARRYEEALAETVKALELDAQNWVAHWLVGSIYAATGRYDEAIAELTLAVEFGGGAIDPLPDLAFAYARAGRRSEADAVLGQLRDTAENEYLAPSYFAIPYAGLGDKERALEWLERAYERRDLYLVWVLSSPALDSLRSEPRFQAIVKNIGLSEYRAAQQEAG